ncbi:UNVERIFIED_CONTAM: hypothetical protein Sindi_0079700 [Sesamum indicum]
MTGEPATEAPIDGGRNYSSPKVEGEEGLLPWGPEPSVRYHSGRARILTLCQGLWAKGQSQVDNFYEALCLLKGTGLMSRYSTSMAKLSIYSFLLFILCLVPIILLNVGINPYIMMMSTTITTIMTTTSMTKTTSMRMLHGEPWYRPCPFYEEVAFTSRNAAEFSGSSLELMGQV